MKTNAISGSGVRKGAWSHEEDNLLRKCIEKYGEGKWHQVPIKAGLNRCRKSCRLRWLNYLKPDIKRGEFAEDEVDLLTRLHKLLGNRWSLIAGRIPGRTANDVKNYWNTHQQKKVITNTPEKAKPKDHLVAKATIFKPRARTFSKSLHCSIGQKPISPSINIHLTSQDNISGIPTAQVAAGDGSQWWDELFGEKEIGGVGWCFGSTDKEEEPITSTFWADQLTATQKLGENLVQEDPNHDFSVLDMDIWNLLNSE